LFGPGKRTDNQPVNQAANQTGKQHSANESSGSGLAELEQQPAWLAQNGFNDTEDIFDRNTFRRVVTQSRRPIDYWWNLRRRFGTI